MTVRTPKRLALGFVAALALIAAGCGGGPAGSSEPGGAAPLVRADALGYVSVDTDLGSSQWKQVDELSKKFSGRALALDTLQAALTKHGVDYEGDVKPALGPEVDVAVVSAGTADTTKVVALTKPDDPSRLKALVAKLNAKDSSGKPAVYREVGGWYALSDSQAAIDLALAGDGASLADDSTFTDAFAKLPTEALVKAYVNGHQLSGLITNAAKKSGNPLGGQYAQLAKLDSLSASVTAENDGVRVEGAVKGSGAGDLVGGGNYDSKLLENAPGDALAFLSFRGGKGLASSLQGVGLPLELALGISPDDLAALLENEVGVYVRPGIGIPEITLAVDSSDVQSGLATLDKLATKLAGLSGGKLSSSGDDKTLTLDGVAIHYGSADGKIVITNAATGVAGYGTSGEKLADSADFREAKSAAGMPDSNGGFLYVDLKDAIPMLLGLAGLSGHQPSPVVTENLRPLRSLLAWSEGSGDTRTFDLFLEIK